MDRAAFRQLGYQMVDWVADYLEDGLPGPVTAAVQPGEVIAKLPLAPPEQPEDGQELFADFKSIILPGVTHWNDPRFFGYFPCNNSAPSVLAELLSAGLDINAMSWATCPAATELEIRMMEWLAQMLALPAWRGVIQDTASTATICAALAARERFQPVNKHGFDPAKPLRAYASEHAHSSVAKAMRVIGLGEDHLRLVPCDADFAMMPQALAAMITADLAAGFQPFFVCASIGTTSSTAVDPLRAICTAVATAAKAAPIQPWIHVDAALAGTAAVLPEMRWLLDGLEGADSLVFNPHKWMFVNFDCSAMYCRNAEELKHALAISPEYLKTEHDAAVENFRDWGLQLGRRFRALKLWFVIRSYGVEGIRARIREHLAMAQWFAAQVRAEPRLQLVGNPRINTVCFVVAGDPGDKTQVLMEALNATGEALLTQTKLNNRYTIRVSFGQTRSTQADAAALWHLLQSKLASPQPPSP